MSSPKLVLAISIGLLALCAEAFAEPALEHFKCYKVKDLKQPKFAKTVVSLSDQFATEDGSFELKKPFLLCVPVDKNGEGITNTEDRLTCYKLKGPALASEERPEIEVANQLGTIRLQVKKPFLLCVPSVTPPPAMCGGCFDTIGFECTADLCSDDVPCPLPNAFCSEDLCSVPCPCCPVCGDGVCEGDESHCGCPSDCSPGAGSCGGVCLAEVPVCGNGVCDRCSQPGESHQTCAQDCPLVCTDCE